MCSRYELADPVGLCMDPEGHDMAAIRELGSSVPAAYFCLICGCHGLIAVFDGSSG